MINEFLNKDILDHPNPFLDKARSDVEIQIESRIKLGECVNLNCGYVNGGDNFTNPLKSTHGNYCDKCSDTFDNSLNIFKGKE